MVKRTLTTLTCLAMFTHAADGVSEKCFAELVELPNTKSNFSFSSFPQELATAVIKVQGGAKMAGIPLLGGMLGPGPDSKMTEAGITVGCAKQIPTDAGKMKSLLMRVGLDMGKTAVASKLGVSKDEIPSNFSELKGFAIKTASLKAGQALGIEESEMPTDLKGVENLVSQKVKSQAAQKLGISESSIPSNKSELSGFIKKSAKAKIASELGVNPKEVNLDAASLAGYASQNETLAPIASLANAANVLEVLGLVSGLSALTGGGGDSDSGSSSLAATDEDEDDDDDEKPAKEEKPVKKAKSSDDDGATKFGLRLAYNGSTVLFEGTNGELGHGLEAGLVVNIPISESLEISIGANGIYRKPENKDYIEYTADGEVNARSELTEIMASLPIFLKYNISSFYLQAGVQVDVPVKREQKIVIGGAETWQEEIPWRNGFDAGIALGLGLNINENISLDIKAVGGATEFNKDIGGYKLVQGSVGLSYFF